jgi:DNA-binding MurR/RpiR family transcriptional regulator
MNNSFLERVKSRYVELTRGHRQVVDRLTQEPKLLAFATAAEIGREAGVSESTVIRLAYTLGYRSFVEMQDDARHTLAPQRTRDVLTRSVSEADSSIGVLSRVMEHDACLIKKTLEQVSVDAFEKAVNLLAQARHIYVAGARSSSGVAVFLAYILSTQLGTATLLEVDHPHFLQDLSGVRPDAVLVAVSFPRYTDSTLRIAEYATLQRCPVVAITDSPISPLARLAQVALWAAIDSPAATDSYVGPLSLATALLTGVALKRKDDVDKQLAHIEQVYADWGTTRRR